MESNSQIFIQTNRQTLTLNRNSTQTLNHLKKSLFPNLNSSSFYFTLNGKPLTDSTQIQNPQITPLSTLILRRRVLGGGGDGGATGAESRDCYLNMYAEKKPDKIDPHEQRLSKWLNCSLSNEPLREPCVVDRLGNVFNKEALVEKLLQKALPREFGYIKGLKDMVPIKLTRVPGTGTGNEAEGSRFQCPITGLEFNGKYRFLVLRKCGHVLSVKALKEVKSSSCLVCHEGFEERDKILINGTEEEVAVLRERMEEDRLKVREKKGKKSRNGGEGVGVESRVSGVKRDVADSGVEKVSGKLDVHRKGGSGSGVPVKAASNGVGKRFKATDVAPPNATKEVYASIFTSSRKSDFKETYSCRSLPLGRN